MSENKNQNTEIDKSFQEIIEEIEKDYKNENEVYLKKKATFGQEAIKLTEERLLKRCEKEKESLSQYMLIEEQNGKQVAKILDGKEKEFGEHYQKFFECSFPINIIYEGFMKNIEISSFFPVKTLKKCLKNARENYRQTKNKEEAKIYVSNCYNFVYEYSIPSSNSIDTKLYENMKAEFKNLDNLI